MIYGSGLPPTDYNPIEVSCLINNDFSDMISFKNPFREAINVLISMETSNDEDKKAFNLLLKKNKATIAGFAVF